MIDISKHEINTPMGKIKFAQELINESLKQLPKSDDGSFPFISVLIDDKEHYIKSDCELKYQISLGKLD